jgi:hypothetical protein
MLNLLKSETLQAVTFTVVATTLTMGSAYFTMFLIASGKA